MQGGRETGHRHRAGEAFDGAAGEVRAAAAVLRRGLGEEVEEEVGGLRREFGALGDVGDVVVGELRRLAPAGVRQTGAVRPAPSGRASPWRAG